ncbi:hypothetical protein [Pontibacter ramchanderi]|uniref:PH (Pleckstrin Homology) domain-containing protein n=1 Tax=Pontibacter ramchanderi TaxID=1179743 RepID=A0A2N3U9K0_9BACT|nr:hypothetical protein [Pontibacter ramchanderi]PKV63406.1 hypothetical protein BD749_3249 [Pontibacter ramchanderi]
MYVNLYPNKELKKTKQILLWSGILLLCGGLSALFGEFIAREELRWGWAGAALLVSALGGLGFAVGAGHLQLKDAYFSMTPERIAYRLTIYGTERVIQWDTIDSIQAYENKLVFELKDSKQFVMRLGNIQSPEIANHVSVSIQLAAIQQQVEVNKVPVGAQQVSQ